MKALDCRTTQRLLPAFHDRELAVADQIAVGAHVEWCDRCAASLAELRAISAAFNTLAASRTALSNEEAGAFNAAVVSRLKAENAASLLARVRNMFDDIRLVYAGLGAAIATVMCVMVTAGMMRFATNERPDSLAAIVMLVATPLECEANGDAGDAAGCRARWEARFHRANESAQQESVFALDAVVTYQSGHLADLAVLRTGRRGAPGQARMIEALLDSANRLRLENSPGIAAVPGSVLWLVERATVRASAAVKPPLETIAPPLKKRADSTIPARAVRA